MLPQPESRQGIRQPPLLESSKELDKDVKRRVSPHVLQQSLQWQLVV
jgi:hypothetical protein